MDDGADAGWLRTEVLCGLNTSMNTIGLRKQQPFGGFKQFKSKAHMNFPETWKEFCQGLFYRYLNFMQVWLFRP